MKITRVDVVLAPRPAVNPPFRWRTGLPGSEGTYTGAWLVIETDEGHTGYAFTVRGTILADLVERRIRSELLGVNPLRREWLWHRMWELDRIEEFPLYTLGAVDDALWDIAGKAAGLPVHELIGSFREEIPAYASTVTFDTIEEYLNVADQCLGLGFPAIKLHAWGDWKRDAELSVRLREHVGPDIPLMFDGSAGFDLADAIALGRVLHEANYLWYEEPMREFSVTAYKLLSRRVNIPLLVAETSDGAHMNSADFIAAGAATAVRTGTTYRGGLTGALRTAHLADSFLMRAEVHGGGLANRHLCMAIPNTTYYESLVTTSSPVVRAPEVDARGMVRAPEGPGMGWEGVWAAEGVPPELAARAW
ncbi:MAG: racemase [Candidatus Lumbricidophila eiseniae]|uniref:Racemase n=1 Tax=Candidatus Lumbricidiphila eiseniae TaxID=1969409 RepID=A0A2A6FU74_9MICO|nr:MAG: racemase [Candidatus Lumbricidophila eiseniae]